MTTYICTGCRLPLSAFKPCGGCGCMEIEEHQDDRIVQVLDYAVQLQFVCDFTSLTPRDIDDFAIAEQDGNTQVTVYCREQDGSVNELIFDRPLWKAA